MTVKVQSIWLWVILVSKRTGVSTKTRGLKVDWKWCGCSYFHHPCLQCAAQGHHHILAGQVANTLNRIAPHTIQLKLANQSHQSPLKAWFGFKCPQKAHTSSERAVKRWTQKKPSWELDHIEYNVALQTPWHGCCEAASHHKHQCKRQSFGVLKSSKSQMSNYSK